MKKDVVENTMESNCCSVVCQFSAYTVRDVIPVPENKKGTGSIFHYFHNWPSLEKPQDNRGGCVSGLVVLKTCPCEGFRLQERRTGCQGQKVEPRNMPQMSTSPCCMLPGFWSPVGSFSNRQLHLTCTPVKLCSVGERVAPMATLDWLNLL